MKLFNFNNKDFLQGWFQACIAVWVVLILCLLGTLLTGCGMQDVYDEGERFNRARIADMNAVDGYLVEAESNTRAEAGRFSDARKADGNAIDRGLVEANKRVLVAKAEATDRLIGSDQTKHEEIDRDIDALQAEVETIYEMIDLIEVELESLAMDDEALASELDALKGDLIDLEAEVEVLDDKTKAKLKKLRRKIRRVARNDDYCTVSVSRQGFWKKTYLSCPNGTYLIEKTLSFGRP